MTSTADTRSTAHVPTPRGERWVKQLGSHLGRKCEVEEVEGGLLLRLAGGSCRMTSDDAVLVLAAAAPDSEALDRVEHVVGGHLERFAEKEGLVVTWQRSAE